VVAISFVAYWIGFMAIIAVTLMAIVVGVGFVTSFLSKAALDASERANNVVIFVHFLAWRAWHRKDYLELENVNNFIAKARKFDVVVANLQSALESLIDVNNQPPGSLPYTWEQAEGWARQALAETRDFSKFARAPRPRPAKLLKGAPKSTEV
jgi:hypothetical protein